MGIENGETALRKALDGAVILDRSRHTEAGDILYPFALEELLCRQVGSGGPPVVHIWRHPGALVMGLRDSRLPGAKQVQTELVRSGISVAVRNSGGAAVPLDLGVVNVTMIVPKQIGKLSTGEDFENMYRLIEQTIGDAAPMHRGEIKGSYCPGDYDLSIKGRKFCGIAQRRQTLASAIQAFIVVEGSGHRHGEIAQYFYGRAANAQPDLDYPHVVPGQMASLSELCGMMQAQTFVENLKKVVLDLGGNADGMASGSLPDESDIAAMIDLLRSRYGI
jgi:octanoyl-[GcvH]:protein N-octanoyltransferase